MNHLFISINLESKLISLLYNFLLGDVFEAATDNALMAGLGHDRADGHGWICGPVPAARGVLGGESSTISALLMLLV